MADEDSAALQFKVKRLPVDFTGSREQKVRFRVRHGKAERFKLPLCVFARLHDFAAVLHVIIVVEKRRRPRRHRHTVDIVGICRILDRAKVGNQRRTADAEAEPCARHTAGFGKGLRYQKIVIFVNERHNALRTEIDIGLVDDDHMIGIRRNDFFDFRNRKCQSCRRVRIGNHDVFADADIIGNADRKIRHQRNRLIRNIGKRCKNRIKAVGDIRKHNGMLRIAERHESKVQNLIGPIGHQNLRCGHAVKARRRLGKRRTFRVGIQLQPFTFRRNRRRNARGRRIRGFIGVKLDIILIARLLAGRIRFKRTIFTAEKSAHVIKVLLFL